MHNHTCDPQVTQVSAHFVHHPLQLTQALAPARAIRPFLTHAQVTHVIRKSHLSYTLCPSPPAANASFGTRTLGVYKGSSFRERTSLSGGAGRTSSTGGVVAGNTGGVGGTGGVVAGSTRPALLSLNSMSRERGSATSVDRHSLEGRERGAPLSTGDGVTNAVGIGVTEVRMVVGGGQGVVGREQGWL
jgi:hypothetical protein